MAEESWKDDENWKHLQWPENRDFWEEFGAQEVQQINEAAFAEGEDSARVLEESSREFSDKVFEDEDR